MNVKEALQFGASELKKEKIEGPEASTNFLLRKVLGVDKKYLILNKEKKLGTEKEKQFRSFIEKRKNHEPVWYITGEIEFYGLGLAVDKNVLIPRPETEILVERVINEIGDEECNILDLGTGSGAIAITLAKKTKGKVYASDISRKALEVAKNNAKMHKADIIFKEGDLLIPWEGYKFDAIVANLPYVPHEDMDGLAPDLTRYEPKEALDGGYRGVEIYKKMFAQLTNVLAGKGIIYCEIGAGQGNSLEKELRLMFPHANVSIVKDYGAKDRILRAELFPK